MRLTPRNTQFYAMFTAANNALDAALMLTKLVNAVYEQRPELARQLKDLTREIGMARVLTLPAGATIAVPAYPLSRLT